MALLKYAHENGCPWNKGTCYHAAQEGHLDMLKYAHENGCPWHADTCKSATYGGYLDVLKYARANGCPWNKKECLKAAQYIDSDLMWGLWHTTKSKGRASTNKCTGEEVIAWIRSQPE